MTKKLISNKSNIKGIIYDLDGTIISTLKLHEKAWLYAGKKFNIPISKEMLITQRGISNKAAASMMLPENKKYLIKEFVNAKTRYVIKNINEVIFYPNILKVIKKLKQSGYNVWVCTSANKNFVRKVINVLKPLKKTIKNNFIWREMYKREKPFPDILNLTIEKMNLNHSQVYYVGDAVNDFQTSVAAKIKFVYFCPDIKKRDSMIPKSIPVISSHKEIFKLLKQ